ncbi:heme biosynthesis HemY N-terminal domain-containing protein [Pararobbsia silviterrae]|uniref:Heme biosynthesis protein HemY n=1 Tax=Pararobbsia silviterrae TaxID=1792498 RepID=A0A494Y1M9_9BURK|nr:heme biosynthesis HemY N-terminal domain-containing protein [Pararobbsia silviterrae]RKP56675.1 heme biosynthesis protein HemY [Pararobbsia silviterrae]
MAMRALFWLVLLFVAAVVIALFGHFDAGHVLIIDDPYRIDVSLNFAIVAIVVAFIVIYVLTRTVRNLWRMPDRVAAYRTRARAAKAHASLRDALANLYAGRFSRAEKAARDAGAFDENQPPAAMIGALAAHRMHEYARRDAWLEQIEDKEWQDARLMASADMRADARDSEGALNALAELEAQGVRRLNAQQIALRAHQQLKHWPEVLKLVKLLEKREAIHPAVALRLRQLSAENLLRDRRHDPVALLACWDSLPLTERQTPRIADLAADLLLQLDRPREARKIVEDALAQQWDARLLRRYADCGGGEALPLIQRAEAWQAEHPDDADLKFTLGRLCLQQQLWGKAQAFLEQALALAGDNDTLKIRAHRALARLHEELGHAGEASTHYRASALAIKLT